MMIELFVQHRHAVKKQARSFSLHLLVSWMILGKFPSFLPIIGNDPILGRRSRTKIVPTTTKPEVFAAFCSPKRREAVNPIRPRARMSKHLSKRAALAKIPKDGSWFLGR
jgi:hypothetical protein